MIVFLTPAKGAVKSYSFCYHVLPGLLYFSVEQSSVCCLKFILNGLALLCLYQLFHVISKNTLILFGIWHYGTILDQLCCSLAKWREYTVLSSIEVHNRQWGGVNIMSLSSENMFSVALLLFLSAGCKQICICYGYELFCNIS